MLYCNQRKVIFLTFGERVKEIRKRKGLSQLDLGERMNISQQAVGRYEKAIDQPKMTTVRKLADALNVAVSELIIDWSAISFDEATEALENSMNYNIENKLRKKLTNNFNKLNGVGQNKAIEQVELLTKIPEYRKDSSTSAPLEPVAAHERTDIAVTEEMKKHDDDIMNDDDF